MKAAVPSQHVRAVVLACLVAHCGGSDGAGPGSPAPTVSPPPPPADLGRLNMDLLAHLDMQALTGRAAAATAAGNWGYTAPDGRRFALTTTSIGLSIVEVTNPRRPRIIRFVEGPENVIREVKTYRQYLYVTSEAREHGLDIIDMGDPDKPIKVKTWQGDFVTAHTLWIDAPRGLLYANGAYPKMGGGGGMYVLDIETNPREPRVIGKFDQDGAGGFYVHDSYLRGNVMFAAAIFDGFVAFLDASDPANIRRMGQFNTGCRFTHNVWPTDDGRYLFTTDERTNCPVEGWDISNPQSPVKVSQYIAAPSGNPHNVMVDGHRLLIAHYGEGVHMLDISDPTRPRVMGFYDTYTGPQPHGCWGAYIFPGSDLIVASDIDGGLFVLGYTGG